MSSASVSLIAFAETFVVTFEFAQSHPEIITLPHPIIKILKGTVPSKTIETRIYPYICRNKGYTTLQNTTKPPLTSQVGDENNRIINLKEKDICSQLQSDKQ